LLNAAKLEVLAKRLEWGLEPFAEVANQLEGGVEP